MDIFLAIFVLAYGIFFLMSVVFFVPDDDEICISTWKGIFNLTFVHEVVVYRFIKNHINKIGIAIVMTLWTAICLPINIVAFVLILLCEIIRGIVILFLKMFGKR